MNSLSITSVKILPIENGIGGCVAIAQLVLCDCVKLTGIKLIDKNGKRYVTYPRNTGNKQKKSYFYPLNNETAELIADALWTEYEKEVKA